MPKGRGAQINPHNRFLSVQRERIHEEGIDDWTEPDPETQYLEENARQVVNKVESPDIPLSFSLNPYQGCEHGCVYCYARNAHEYWGYSAGLDFERKIIVKRNAPELFRKWLLHPKYQCTPVSLSGNTDCYQPIERKLRITRRILEVAREFNQPIGIITKNAGILRDKDILQDLAKANLVNVFVSITTLQEPLRRLLEPRTTTALQRLRIIEELSSIGVPMGVMTAPIIPGLNDHEIPELLKAAAQSGARQAGYTIVRLNGAVGLLFRNWLDQHFPDRADKVWHMIENCHGGQVNDSRFGTRMRGEGPVADMIHTQFDIHTRKYGFKDESYELDTSKFRRPGEQMELF
jgi:DNA repair photolyase